MNRFDLSGYPRPDFARDDWHCLNGEWDFSFDEPVFDKKILVPFAYQCEKSGIGDLTDHEVVWYRRTFDVNGEKLATKRLLLKFGAVDYEAIVYVNGLFVGRHVGGYGSFELDITDYVHAGENELKVKVIDGLEADKPRGKQSWTGEPFRCWYTAMNGIWQDVWMEYVGEVHIKRIRITPKLELNQAICEVFISDNRKCEVELSAVFEAATREETIDYGKYIVPCELGYGRCVIVFPEYGYRRKWYTWNLDQPNLIYVTAKLKSADRVQDSVITYFGMRSVDIKDGQFYLNSESRMHRLVLNQGYWADTLLTPPDGEALKKDLELIKAMGFNGVRMHQKVENPKFYYWADKLGLMVWGELPSAYHYRDTMVRRTAEELLDFIERDYNHPSIVVWVPVNESWGATSARVDVQQQSYINMMYHLIRSVDMSRVISGNDGWEQTDCTDILAVHDYALMPTTVHKYDDMEGILKGAPELRKVLACGYSWNGQPVMMTEYGGIAFDDGREGWGYYNKASTQEEFLERLEFITSFLIKSGKFAGFCYTQFTDVQQEKNGLLYIDRTPKVSVEELHRIFAKQYYEE